MQVASSPDAPDPGDAASATDPSEENQRPLANQIVTVTSRFARAVTQVSGIAISPLSMRVLSYIERYGPQRISVMASVESISQPAMTSAVNRLAKDGLVTRQTDPVDARAQLVDMTDQGQEMLAQYRRQAARVLQPRLETLSAEDYATIERTVEILETLTHDLTGFA